ncbi:hypothetical protein M8J75_008642 [Diaphorina citri]|nr:hypothetical protein M8J75_008642 [Diaphorina citri]
MDDLDFQLEGNSGGGLGMSRGQGTEKGLGSSRNRDMEDIYPKFIGGAWCPDKKKEEEKENKKEKEEKEKEEKKKKEEEEKKKKKKESNATPSIVHFSPTINSSVAIDSSVANMIRPSVNL